MINVLQYKTLARKNIAKCESILKKKISNDDRLVILKIIANERNFIKYNFNNISDNDKIIEILDNIRFSGIRDAVTPEAKVVIAEMMQDVPGAPPKYVAPNNIPTVGKLLSLLERIEREESSFLQSDPHPSANDIKRWALKAAVLNYYKDLGMPPDMQVSDVVGDQRTKDELAPNKSAIYNIWIQLLERQSVSDDKYKLSMDEYDEAVQRGTPRGGAFEKMLDRYREEFMQELWKDYNKEVSNGQFG